MPNMKALSLKVKKLSANQKCDREQTDRHRQTDGQTDRQTDGRTEDKVIPKWRFASLAPKKLNLSPNLYSC